MSISGKNIFNIFIIISYFICFSYHIFISGINLCLFSIILVIIHITFKYQQSDIKKIKCGLITNHNIKIYGGHYVYAVADRSGIGRT